MAVPPTDTPSTSRTEPEPSPGADLELLRSWLATTASGRAGRGAPSCDEVAWLYANNPTKKRFVEVAPAPAGAALAAAYAPVPCWVRIAGDRRLALAAPASTSTSRALAERCFAHAPESGAALAYAFADAHSEELPPGFAPLGAAPLVVRPLRLGYAAELFELPAAARARMPKAALVAPFGRGRRAGVREITVFDPRITRLWERFSIDVGVSVERSAAYVGWRIFDRPEGGYRVLIVEDGDRYSIRAMCIFRLPRHAHAGATATSERVGYVLELLHDRSVQGMRDASHLLGLAVREMSDAGADAVFAWSLPHSGSFPMYVRHAFLPAPRTLRTRGQDLRFGARTFDPDLEDIVHRRESWYLSYLDALAV